MAQLSSKIKQYVGSEVDFQSDVIIQDDGQGAYIKEWNLDTPKPTQAQLDALETAAVDEEYNNSQIQKRIAEYGQWKDQLDEIYTDIDAWKTRIAAIKAKYPKR
jgi:hypothetical protein